MTIITAVPKDYDYQPLTKAQTKQEKERFQLFMPQQLSNVQILREAIWGNGFRPIAIRHGLKYPVEKGWTDLARLNPPRAIQDVRHDWGDGYNGGYLVGRGYFYPNTGILADGLQPTDIDVDDDRAYAIAEWCLTNLGPAPIRYRENATRLLLLYAAAEGVPSKASIGGKTTGGVEVLGKGNQFLGYGTHTSGATLRWLDDQGPHNTQRGDLTTITRDQAQELLRFAGTVLGVEYKPDTVKIPRITSDHFGPGMGFASMCMADIRGCLDGIPNPDGYDDWRDIGFAVHDASGGSHEGLQAWVNWSDDPTDCDKTWNAIRSGGGITTGTLIAKARESDPDFILPSKTIGKLKTFI